MHRMSFIFLLGLVLLVACNKEPSEKEKNKEETEKETLADTLKGTYQLTGTIHYSYGCPDAPPDTTMAYTDKLEITACGDSLFFKSALLKPDTNCEPGLTCFRFMYVNGGGTLTFSQSSDSIWVSRVYATSRCASYTINAAGAKIP